jgi:hypothetical protein
MWFKQLSALALILCASAYPTNLNKRASGKVRPASGSKEQQLMAGWYFMAATGVSTFRASNQQQR